jgi:hypothetical protein
MHSIKKYLTSLTGLHSLIIFWHPGKMNLRSRFVEEAAAELVSTSRKFRNKAVNLLKTKDRHLRSRLQGRGIRFQKGVKAGCGKSVVARSGRAGLQGLRGNACFRVCGAGEGHGFIRARDAGC